MSEDPQRYCVETTFSSVAVSSLRENFSFVLSHYFDTAISAEVSAELVDVLVMAATMAESEAEETIPGLSEYVKDTIEGNTDASDIFEALGLWGEMAHNAGLTPYIIHAHPVDEEGA